MEIDPLKIFFLLNMGIFHCHVIQFARGYSYLFVYCIYLSLHTHCVRMPEVFPYLGVFPTPPTTKILHKIAVNLGAPGLRWPVDTWYHGVGWAFGFALCGASGGQAPWQVTEEVYMRFTTQGTEDFRSQSHLINPKGSQSHLIFSGISR